jgi:hypothetical protein
MDKILQHKQGEDPDRDAWLTSFFTENHLAYEAYPDMVASPEQLNFIVHMDGEPFYYPCSEELFAAIVEKRADSLLTTAYMGIWSRLEHLVREIIEDPFKQRYLLSLLSVKFQHETASKLQLPDRLEKRLLGIFRTISEIARPLAGEKELENRRVVAFIESEVFQKLFNSTKGLALQENTTLDDLDLHLHLLRLQRLLLLSSMRTLWKQDTAPTAEALAQVLDTSLDSEGWDWLCGWMKDVLSGRRRPYVLWISGRSGEIVLDLVIIRLLMKMGIKVILAVKHGFFFHRISYVDMQEDSVLELLVEDADFITEPQISKNELLRRLASDNRLLVISDGTYENFNPLLTSVTFARAFKEVDLVISRCPGSRECIGNHFQFTRDLVSIISHGPGEVDIFRKPHHPGAIRFSEAILRRKAEKMIQEVRREKEQGKACMFYSAIVGSIPGQLKMAKNILNVFVEHLRASLDNVVIINPGEHFEEGMDADDIMYMWEIFQRSGVIDIWRFQSVVDVEKAFLLMGEKVPPEWTGKDATFSTGCTKEMEIAMDIQTKYPEMQLIGPSWEKFLRRKEYGVGKLYDRALADRA